MTFTKQELQFIYGACALATEMYGSDMSDMDESRYAEMLGKKLQDKIWPEIDEITDAEHDLWVRQTIMYEVYVSYTDKSSCAVSQATIDWSITPVEACEYTVPKEILEIGAGVYDIIVLSPGLGGREVCSHTRVTTIDM